MTTITIPLTKQQAEKLAERAVRYRVTPEELALRGIEELLARLAADPATEMDALIDSVLEKNAELYRRLA